MNFRVYYNALHWGRPYMPGYWKPLRCRIFGHRYEDGAVSVLGGKVSQIQVKCERCGYLSDWNRWVIK